MTYLILEISQLTIFDETNGKPRYVYSYPSSVVFFRGLESGSASAKWIKHEMSLHGTGKNNALQQL